MTRYARLTLVPETYTFIRFVMKRSNAYPPSALSLVRTTLRVMPLFNRKGKGNAKEDSDPTQKEKVKWSKRPASMLNRFHKALQSDIRHCFQAATT